VSGNGTNTVTISIPTISGSGTLGISIAAGTIVDAAGNSTALSLTGTACNVDTSVPTLTLSAPSAVYARSGQTVSYIINLGEGTAFDDSKVVLTGTATTGASVAVTGTGATRTIAVTVGSGNGLLGINLNSGAITDALGNPSVAITGTTFTVDNIGPSLDVEYNGYTQGTWTNSDVNVGLKATDTSAGNDKLEYSLNGSTWTEINTNTNNLLNNSNFSTINTVSYAWDESKNGNKLPEGWSGYNDGVTSPGIGYHVHADDTTFSYPVLEFNNLNSEVGLTSRWLGTSTLLNTLPKASTTYTISMDIYADTVNMIETGGMYHGTVGQGGRNFASGTFTFITAQNEINKWVRKTYTFTSNSTLDEAVSAYFYIYGTSGEEGTFYVKNVKLEEGSTATPWTQSASEATNNVMIGNIYFTSNMNSNIYYKATDIVGNVTATSANNIKIDKTKPTVTINPNSSVSTREKSVTITASDAGGSTLLSSNTYQYQLGTSSTVAPTGAWTTYTSDVPFTIGTGLNGTYYLWVRQIADTVGNLSVATVGAYHVSGAFDFDNTAPTAGSVSINSGASYTKTTAVTLTISANNATEMSICNSSTVGTWIPYSTTNSHTLETTNGNKTVYVWFRDENGNESVYASDTIILDTAAPTISFSANSNATAAKIQSVQATVTEVTSGKKTYKYLWSTSATTPTTEASFTHGTFSHGSTISSPVSLTDGNYYLHIYMEDNAGNITTTRTTGTFAIKNSAPTAASVSINGGATYTNSTSTSLTLNATGATQMYISNSSTAPDGGTTWISYASTYSWTLLTGDGTKTVYVWYNDGIGNITAVTDTITLHTVAPTACSVSINSGATYTNTTSTTLTLAATDTLSGIQMNISNTSTKGSWEAFATSKSWTLSNGDGSKTVYVWFKDAAGNETAVTDTITLDTTLPNQPTITGPVPTSINAATSDKTAVWTLTSTEGVINLTPAQVTKTGSGTTSGTVVVSGSGTNTITVSVPELAGTGTIGINITAGTLVDPANNTITLNRTGTVCDVDTVAPTMVTATAPTAWQASSFVNGQTMIYNDPTFALGMNSTQVYNNLANGNVTITRGVIADSPVGSYGLTIRTTGTANPGHGGFCYTTPSSADKIYLSKIIAKIPEGLNLYWHSTQTGTGATVQWLTSSAGTGKWEEYIIQLNCGNAGTFGTTNYYSVEGGDTATPTTPVEWQVAYSTVFDITNSKNKTITATSSDANGISGYYIATDTTAPTLASTWISSTSTTCSINKPLGTYNIWVKDSADNISSTYSTVSVDNVDIIMPKINSVTVPTVYGTSNTATISAVETTASAVSEASGLTEYAISDTLAIPSTGWQASNEFTFTVNGTFYAWVKDAAGNISASKRFVIDKVDTAAPSAPTVVMKLNDVYGALYTGANFTNQNVYVELTSTDDVAVTSYEWYENGAWTTRAFNNRWSRVNNIFC
jgi:hypothetical protein